MSGSSGRQQGARCPLQHMDTVLWAQARAPAAQHSSKACPRPVSLRPCNNGNQNPRQATSRSLACDHVTGQEGRRHFDQAGITLNSFHADTSATGISTPTPQTSHSQRHVLLWHVCQGQSNALGLDEGCSQSQVTVASSLQEGREPPCALSGETKAQRGRLCLIVRGGGSSSTCPGTSCSTLLADRGLRMPRELQAASSLPSQNNGAIVGARASVGRSPGLAVIRWVGRWHPLSSSPPR